MKQFFRWLYEDKAQFIVVIIIVIVLIVTIIDALKNHNKTTSTLICPQGMYATAITPTSITCVRP